MLPELREGGGPADLEILFEALPERLAEARIRSEEVDVGESEVLMRLEDMRFLVSDGARIAIDAPPGKAGIDIRIWLLGTVMAALLHQRGFLPLHANLVALERGGAAAFVGDSGAGKSTLAGWFEQHGHRVLGDDLCAVRFDDAGRPLVYPGIPRLKLWKESLRLLGRSPLGLERVASDLDKYHVPLARDDSADSLAPLALRRVYVLSRVLGRAEHDGQPLIAPIAGGEAAAAVLANAFRWYLGQAIHHGARSQFDQCVAVARHAGLFMVHRTWGHDRFAAEAEAIEAHLAANHDSPR